MGGVVPVEKEVAFINTSDLNYKRLLRQMAPEHYHLQEMIHVFRHVRGRQAGNLQLLTGRVIFNFFLSLP